MLLFGDSNPLHAVAGSARFLLEKTSPGDSLYEDVVTILSGASQMSRLISDIMDWSKVSAGKIDLVLEATYFPSLLKDVVRRPAASPPVWVFGACSTLCHRAR